jgi:hypothetical protein
MTPEDEAFDELAKRQGAWGGGFPAKRAMAADKYSDIVSDGGLDPRNKMDAQSAQEPVGTLNISRYKGHLVNHDFDYFGELPDGTYSVYTAPPKREWVGMTDEEIREIHSASRGQDVGVATGLIEAKLKEKNNGT